MYEDRNRLKYSYCFIKFALCFFGLYYLLQIHAFFK